MKSLYLSITFILFAVEVEGLRCFNCTYADKPSKYLEGGNPNCAEPFNSEGIFLIECNDQCVKRILRSENSVTQRTCHRKGKEKCNSFKDVSLPKGRYRNSESHDVTVSQHCCRQSRCNDASSIQSTTFMVVLLGTMSGFLNLVRVCYSNIMV